MLEVKSLNHGYIESTKERKEILRDLSIQILAGRCIALLGGNGSGKSTLLRCMNGEVIPDSGSVYLNGIDITGKSIHERAAKIATIQQDPVKGSASEMSVLENLRIAALRKHIHYPKLGITKEFRQKAIHVMAETGLQDATLSERLAGKLSGGQRQMLALSMALISEPSYLLMDEPGAALDPKASANLCTLTRRIAKEHNIGVLMITHNYSEAVSFADEVWLLKEGKITDTIGREETDKFQGIYFLKQLELELT